MRCPGVLIDFVRQRIKPRPLLLDVGVGNRSGGNIIRCCSAVFGGALVHDANACSLLCALIGALIYVTGILTWRRHCALAAAVFIAAAGIFLALELLGPDRLVTAAFRGR